MHLPFEPCICEERAAGARSRARRAARGESRGRKIDALLLGGSADRIGEPGIEAHMENTIQVFRSVRSEALDLGVKIAIENHDGDMQAREVRSVIEESGKDLVGATLDTGNPCGWWRTR